MSSVLLQIFFDKHITPGSHTRRRTLSEFDEVFCSLRTGASYITEAALSQVDSQSLNTIGSFGNINFGRFAMKFVFMCALFYVTSMN